MIPGDFSLRGTVPLTLQTLHGSIPTAGDAWRCDRGDAYLFAHAVWIARSAVMDDGQTRVSRLTRRGFLGGIAASAAAAILAACGGSKATDTPKPAGTTGAAPTTAAA